VPESFQEFKSCIIDLMQKIHTTANFKASENEKLNNVNEAFLEPNDNFSKKEFQDLWNKIKVKTVYEVDFNSNELIEKSINALDNNLTVKRVTVNITELEQRDKLNEEILKKGEGFEKKKDIIEKAESMLGTLEYDVVAEMAKETNLTRKTVVTILQGIKKSTFQNFKINPESFIKNASYIINSEKAATLIDNITYSKTDKSYDDTVFTINNFTGSLAENILKVKKHVYDYVKTESKVERTFAENLESGEVSVYAKLPKGFVIPTPVGNYNPDWAIVFDTDKFKYIYFIAETKGSLESLQLKEVEKQKINYARKHFDALGHKDIKYDVISTYQDLKDKILE